jgi:transposase InsO family protein
MPWSSRSILSLREEFVTLAAQPDANVRELCRRYDVSPTTAYKWLARFRDEGRQGLADRSRRPVRQPLRTAAVIEDAVLAVRDEHPAWGNRKIRARLLALGHRDVPSSSTIQSILRRYGRTADPADTHHKAYVRFERDAPNSLWQMDFKGHFPTSSGRCHPLTVLDDHSRFSVVLHACPNERGITVQSHLTTAFRRYGMPEQILTDNGPPWGVDGGHSYTPLVVWLIRLGITPLHGRPYHPQTQGKEERFHRTLQVEVLRNRIFRNLDHVQRDFVRWRDVYNLERPHEALNLAPPATRYTPSRHAFPERLPPIEYDATDMVRMARSTMGRISFAGREWKVGKSFVGLPLAVRPTTIDGVHAVFFCHLKVREIDLREPADEAA